MQSTTNLSKLINYNILHVLVSLRLYSFSNALFLQCFKKFLKPSIFEAMQGHISEVD